MIRPIFKANDITPGFRKTLSGKIHMIESIEIKNAERYSFKRVRGDL